jgi:hypothetical protein
MPAPDTISEPALPEAAPAAAKEPQVEVSPTSMTIHDLSIERASIVSYLLNIAPDKQIIALVHALDVGVTELIARRERFRH